MEFALRLYIILDSMYTFICSAQILNTVHQCYQMVIYSSKTSLPPHYEAGIANRNFEPPANHAAHWTAHHIILLTKMKLLCLFCFIDYYISPSQIKKEKKSNRLWQQFVAINSKMLDKHFKHSFVQLFFTEFDHFLLYP